MNSPIARLTLAALFLPASLLTAWNARFTPAENNVTWPVPEDATERAVTVFNRPDLTTDQFLHGEVQVAGETATRPLLARLDGNGQVLWSKRLPPSGDLEQGDSMALVRDDTLLTFYRSPDELQPLDYIGSFNPNAAFNARFRYSLPALGFNPLNPLENPSRDFYPHADGGLSVIEIHGNEIKVLNIGPDGNQRFAKVYTLPTGGDGGFPIPGFSTTSYLFAMLWELEDGGYYLSTNGMDLMNESSTSHVLRLDSSGDIDWQVSIEMPGAVSFALPMPDSRVFLTGWGFGDASARSLVVLLNEDGSLRFARQIQNFASGSSGYLHYDATGDILLNGTIPSGEAEFGLEGDSAVLLLSAGGDKIAETAFGMGDMATIVHIGTDNQQMYFDVVEFSPDSGDATSGLLLRLDNDLGDPLASSYLEKAGPSAIFSSFFSANGQPFIAYRDEPQDWITINQLDRDLVPVGECDIMTPVDLDFYDPQLVVTPFSPIIETSAASVSNWDDAPALTPAVFLLEDTPLTREATCGDTSGGGDPVNPWEDLEPAHPSGAKDTGIGWIDDAHFPVIWHYNANRYLVLIPELTVADEIIGWDPVDEFWFWTAPYLDGWYYRITPPGGWYQW
jgi:hypothetical protein